MSGTVVLTVSGVDLQADAHERETVMRNVEMIVASALDESYLDWAGARSGVGWPSDGELQPVHPVPPR